MDICGCFNLQFVRCLMEDNNKAKEAVIDFILTVGFEEEFQRVYLEEKSQRFVENVKESNRNNVKVELAERSGPVGITYIQKEANGNRKKKY